VGAWRWNLYSRAIATARHSLSSAALMAILGQLVKVQRRALGLADWQVERATALRAANGALRTGLRGAPRRASRRAYLAAPTM
jgi:hypothetical protein